MAEKIKVMTMEGEKTMTRDEYEKFMDACKVKKADRVPVQPTLDKATKEQKQPATPAKAPAAPTDKKEDKGGKGKTAPNTK